MMIKRILSSTLSAIVVLSLMSGLAFSTAGTYRELSENEDQAYSRLVEKTDAYEAQEARLRQANTELEEAENAVQTAKDDFYQSLSVEIETKKKAYDDAVFALNEAETQKQTIDAEIQELIALVPDLQNDVSDKQTAVENVGFDNDGYQKVLAEYDAAVAAYNNAKTRASEYNQTLSTLKENYEAAADAYSDAVFRLEAAKTKLAEAQAAEPKDAKEEKQDEQIEESSSDSQQELETGTKTSLDFFLDMGSENAVDILLNSRYSEYTEIGDKDDATSLVNMLNSLELIRYGNNIRTSLGLSSLVITDSMMAMAQADANYSDCHLAHAEQFYVGENLAWNYGTNPFFQWYDEEKVLYDNYIANGWTLEQIMADETVMEEVGHYLNDINPDYDITGFAISTKRNTNYWITYSQTYQFFDGETAYTVDEYYNRLVSYMETYALPSYLNKHSLSDTITDCEEGVSSAEEDLALKEKALADAKAALDAFDPDQKLYNEINTELMNTASCCQAASDMVDTYSQSVSSYNSAVAEYDQALDDLNAVLAEIDMKEEAKKGLSIGALEKEVNAAEKAYNEVKDMKEGNIATSSLSSGLQEKYDTMNEKQLNLTEKKDAYDIALADYEKAKADMEAAEAEYNEAKRQLDMYNGDSLNQEEVSDSESLTDIETENSSIMMESDSSQESKPENENEVAYEISNAEEVIDESNNPAVQDEERLDKKENKKKVERQIHSNELIKTEEEHIIKEEKEFVSENAVSQEKMTKIKLSQTWITALLLTGTAFATAAIIVILIRRKRAERK